MGGGEVSSELSPTSRPTRARPATSSRPPARRRRRRSSSRPARPVITIGGFTGSDPAPTTAQLAKLVADGDLSYVLIGGGGGRGGGSSDVTAWVQAHGTAVTSVSTDGMTLYKVA